MIGPFLISIGGKGIALTIFFDLVNSFKFERLIVEIKLMIFLFFANVSLPKILFPTVGVIAKNII